MEAPQLAVPHGIAAAHDWTPLLIAAPNVNPLAAKRSKRLLDLFGALVLIVLTAPLMLIISLLIRLDGGPAIFRHRRIGLRGKTFPCLKFRTMHIRAREMLAQHLAANPEAQAEWAASFKLKSDPRVTRLGRFLRKTSLDELPQLWNVLRGEMSLIGPRPIVSQEVAKYGVGFALYAQVLPGLTGLWQVSGRNDTYFSRRVDLDCQYIRNWTVALDLKILLKTAGVVARGRGAY